MDCVTRRAFLAASGTALTMSTSCLHFETAGAATRFGVFTDPHYADREPANNRYYRDSAGKMAVCVNAFNAESLDFVIELGDFKDQDTPPVEEKTLAYLRYAESIFKTFNGPRYHVLGNHDVDSISKAQFQAEVENTGIDQMRTYYSFDAPYVRGIVLDACYTSDGKDYDHGHFDWTDANLPGEQLAWLKRTLDETPEKAIVFCHQRLDGEGDLFVKNAAQVRAILEGSRKVLAVFQGHDHKGDFRSINGITYRTLRGMVEGPGPENTVYTTVQVHADGTISMKETHISDESGGTGVVSIDLETHTFRSSFATE